MLKLKHYFLLKHKQVSIQRSLQWVELLTSFILCLSLGSI